MGSIDETVNNLNGLVAAEAEAMLYDDYFSDPDDEGVEAVIEHRGKPLVFRLKRSLTLEEKQRAADAGVSIEVDKEGTPKLTKMDQAAYTREIVLAGIKEWPFRYGTGIKVDPKFRGAPVPINRQTVSRMDGALADKIAAVLLGQRGVQQKALDPFEQKSDAAS